jgi:hypothetical protein
MRIAPWAITHIAARRFFASEGPWPEPLGEGQRTFTVIFMPGAWMVHRRR